MSKENFRIERGLKKENQDSETKIICVICGKEGHSRMRCKEEGPNAPSPSSKEKLENKIYPNKIDKSNI